MIIFAISENRNLPKTKFKVSETARMEVLETYTFEKILDFEPLNRFLVVFETLKVPNSISRKIYVANNTVG